MEGAQPAVPQPAIGHGLDAGEAFTVAGSFHAKARDAATKSPSPRLLGNPSPKVGDDIETQVAAKIADTRALLAPGLSIEDAIRAWPLPMTFYDPMPPLCDVEIELLAGASHEEPAESDEGESKPAADARLLPGMVRG